MNPLILILQFLAPFQDCETINFCYLNHSDCDTCYSSLSKLTQCLRDNNNNTNIHTKWNKRIKQTIISNLSIPHKSKSDQGSPLSSTCRERSWLIPKGLWNLYGQLLYEPSSLWKANFYYHYPITAWFFFCSTVDSLFSSQVTMESSCDPMFIIPKSWIFCWIWWFIGHWILSLGEEMYVFSVWRNCETQL